MSLKIDSVNNPVSCNFVSVIKIPDIKATRTNTSNLALLLVKKQLWHLSDCENCDENHVNAKRV